MISSAPWLYRLTQRVAAPGADRNLSREIGRLLQELPPPGRCLDVGCGPDSILRRLGLNPVGIDLCHARVLAFARANGLAAQAEATALPFADGIFDSVWSFGLLHHLPDEAARSAIKEMRRVTHPGGFIVVVDGVLPSSVLRRPFAALIRGLDRGGWMRTQESLETLLTSGGQWNCRRLTYATTGLECVLALGYGNIQADP